MPRNTDSPIDRYVGARVRMRRMMIGMSQDALGMAIGVTFQQCQKYERGSNRISASRLHQISVALGVPVGWFFEGAPDIGGAIHPEASAPPYETEMLSTPDGMALVRAFAGIRDVGIRRRVVEFAEALGNRACAELMAAE